jgi:hypothetical protein
MKAEKLSTEIAALERQSGKAKNAVIKKVLTGKINKLKAELEAITSVPVAKDKIKKAKSKISKMTVKEFSSYIKQLAKDPKFSFLKSMTSDEIVRDIKRTAKPVGWRFRGRENAKKPTRKDIKENNNVYYEGRRNRSDVSRSVRLATGGGTQSNSRIDKMVESWNEQGKAWSNISNNDNEFFKRIGVPYELLGTSSDTGTDIMYYDTEQYGLYGKKKMATGGGVEKATEYERRHLNDFPEKSVIVYDDKNGLYKEKAAKISIDYSKNYGGSFSVGIVVDNKIKVATLQVLPNGEIILIKGEKKNVYADGGGVDLNDWDMPVIRTQFEDEEYEYAKGGSIGDSGTITDKNSMFVGKLGLITGEVGNMYEVKVLDNGNYRTVLVKKNGISIVSDEFANGGNTGEPHRAEMSGMMKNGGGTKKYYNHKITVTDKFDNVYDVALFRGKGDAFIALSALDKAKTSDLFYELKENK